MPGGIKGLRHAPHVNVGSWVYESFGLHPHALPPQLQARRKQAIQRINNPGAGPGQKIM